VHDYSSSAPKPSSGPPPGWYHDPDGIPVLRWWDGFRWGPQTQPLPAGPEGTGRHRAPAGPDLVTPAALAQDPATAAARRASAGWAWTVATAPVTGALVAIIVSSNSASDSAAVTAGWVATDIVAIIAAQLDARVLAARGELGGTGIGWLSLLGGWPYLLARAVRRTPRGAADWWVFVTAVVLWLVAVLFTVPLGGGNGTSSGTCTTASCIVPDAESLKGDVAKDNSVITGVTCTPSTVRQVVSGTWTVHCTATYSDGSKWAGIASILTGKGDVDWEPTSMVSAGS